MTCNEIVSFRFEARVISISVVSCWRASPGFQGQAPATPSARCQLVSSLSLLPSSIPTIMSSLSRTVLRISTRLGFPATGARSTPLIVQRIDVPRQYRAISSSSRRCSIPDQIKVSLDLLCSTYQADFSIQRGVIENFGRYARSDISRTGADTLYSWRR